MIEALEILQKLERRRYVNVSVEVLAYYSRFGDRRSLRLPSVNQRFAKTQVVGDFSGGKKRPDNTHVVVSRNDMNHARRTTPVVLELPVVLGQYVVWKIYD